MYLSQEIFVSLSFTKDKKKSVSPLMVEKRRVDRIGTTYLKAKGCFSLTMAMRRSMRADRGGLDGAVT